MFQFGFNILIPPSRGLRHIGDTFNYISYIMLLCTIIKETEHESAWIFSCKEIFYSEKSGRVSYNAVSYRLDFTVILEKYESVLSLAKL